MSIYEYVFTTLLLMIFAHALADFPLKAYFVINQHDKHGQLGFPYLLLTHATIHGGFVGIITGSLTLGIAEFAVHAWLDWRHNEGDTTMLEDQLWHVACKFVWTALAATFLWGG